MPSYGGNGLAGVLPYTFINEQQQVYLWENEAVPTGTLSRAVQVQRVGHASYPWGLSFELWFDGDPGTFEIDLLAANVDESTHYVSIGSITAVNASFVGRFDMPTHVWPRYVAATVASIMNAVNISLLVTR